MNRRDTMLALAALGAAPLSALAQQGPGKALRIGFLSSTSASASGWRMVALRAGLRDFGYVEGNNLVIESRWAEEKYERLPELAAELVRLRVDMIVTHGTPASLAAKRATSTIPIVMAAALDPVATGLVTSLSRPGGNITGATFFNAELCAKRLELIKEAFPHIRRVAFLFNSDNPAAPLREMEAAAVSLGLDLQQSGVRRPGELESAFAAMSKRHVEAIATLEDPMLVSNVGMVAGIAARHRMPSVGFIELADGGGLMAYGVNFPTMFRRAAYFVNKIARGTDPRDLPIEQATRFDLVVNLKTARELGLAIPQSILLRADRMIG